MVTGFAQWFEWQTGYALLDVIEKIERHPIPEEQKDAWNALHMIHERYCRARGIDGTHGVFGSWSTGVGEA